MSVAKTKQPTNYEAIKRGIVVALYIFTYLTRSNGCPTYINIEKAHIQNEKQL
jgi:hypothetical protein